jgi:hypothetical protein
MDRADTGPHARAKRQVIEFQARAFVGIRADEGAVGFLVVADEMFGGSNGALALDRKGWNGWVTLKDRPSRDLTGAVDHGREPADCLLGLFWTQAFSTSHTRSRLHLTSASSTMDEV